VNLQDSVELLYPDAELRVARTGDERNKTRRTDRDEAGIYICGRAIYTRLGLAWRYLIHTYKEPMLISGRCSYAPLRSTTLLP
jgi:hypothetical protein